MLKSVVVVHCLPVPVVTGTDTVSYSMRSSCRYSVSSHGFERASRASVLVSLHALSVNVGVTSVAVFAGKLGATSAHALVNFGRAAWRSFVSASGSDTDASPSSSCSITRQA